MKAKTISLLLAILLSCKETKSDRLDIKDISRLIPIPADKILFNKLYNVNRTPEPEHTLLLLSRGALYSVFVRQDGSGLVEPVRSLGEKGEYLKSQFINTGDGYSHVLHIFRQSDIHILLLVAPGFVQEIPASKQEANRLFIQKLQENKPDEILLVGDKSYRFNGLSYTDFHLEMPFLFYEGFHDEADGPYLTISNRGAFTSRAIITLSFPGAQNHEMTIRKQFAHVKKYPTGSIVHYRGGKTVRTVAPMVEIIREPFAAGGRMSLPLTLAPGPRKILLRAVFYFRGSVLNWPTEGALDQQGYPALSVEFSENN